MGCSMSTCFGRERPLPPFGFLRDPEAHPLKRQGTCPASACSSVCGCRSSHSGCPLDGLSQIAGPMTSARIRALTRNAQARGGSDPTELVLALDASVRAQWGDFESFPLSVLRREDLNITLSDAIHDVSAHARELSADRQTPRRRPWIAAAVITVEPERIDAPDITRLVVERGGKPVPALDNLLRPKTYMNGNGDRALIHAGEVRFPLSAFAPGAPVTISAIPRPAPRS